MDAKDEQTTEQPAVDPAREPVTRSEPRFHARTAAIVAGGFVLLLLAFLAGLATGDDDGRGDRFERMGERGGMPFGGSERGGMQGGPGGERGGMGGPGGERGMGGRGGGPGGGTMGVVESVGAGSLEVAAFRGEAGTVTVTVNDETTITTRGDAGPQDIEEASLEDIDEGDVVMVRADRDAEDEDGAVTADRIMIVHDAGE